MTKKKHKKSNDGKKYEKKVSAMVRKLYPNSEIKDDVKLPATITGGKRQVDTLLDTGTQQIDFDAKDHKRNIGIKDVADYGFKLKDEGVPLGVMVSNSPYAESAVAAAKFFGIRPTHLIDTTDKENPFAIASKTLIEVRYVKALSFGIKHTSVGSGFNVYQDLGRQELVSDDGSHTVIAYDVFKDVLWNSGYLVERIEEFNNGADGWYAYTLPKQEIVMADGTRGVIDEFSFNYEVGTQYLDGKWNVKHAQGIFDAAKNTFQTNQNVESESLTIEELQNWPKVDPATLDKTKYGIRISVIGELPDYKMAPPML
ncbi:hypothetical protein L336_0165 [Candidatus Saccharimonas aalborgensis]|uniref:Restriction endonuclease type IV Mrr domain-containing protein n=1 Tax=Candidatus Saccharimonas aalborgensis TaxID=1332188 RepID=R4PUP4_9BACT|nr:hypothetical protein [Candidatus Saccharimonas aalborgensis]AGL61875.1 hypothetical protein L336_0165 [Candidatus Saccharimonas aalborgensis]QQS68405.1 MAG: hypothetical protein IPP24_05385 [Candidatus Saccharibacteria bacterium]